MTICHFLGTFAYTHVLRKRYRIARNGPGHAFVHFFKKTCLNRADFETTSATSSCRNPSIFDLQSSMAIMPSPHSKTGNFCMFLHTFPLAESAIPAGGICKRRVLSWVTSRAAFVNAIRGITKDSVWRPHFRHFSMCAKTDDMTGKSRKW